MILVPLSRHLQKVSIRASFRFFTAFCSEGGNTKDTLYSIDPKMQMPRVVLSKAMSGCSKAHDVKRKRETIEELLQEHKRARHISKIAKRDGFVGGLHISRKPVAARFGAAVRALHQLDAVGPPSHITNTCSETYHLSAESRDASRMYVIANLYRPELERVLDSIIKYISENTHLLRLGKVAEPPVTLPLVLPNLCITTRLGNGSHGLCDQYCVNDIVSIGVAYKGELTLNDEVSMTVKVKFGSTTSLRAECSVYEHVWCSYIF